MCIRDRVFIALRGLRWDPSTGTSSAYIHLPEKRQATAHKLWYTRARKDPCATGNKDWEWKPCVEHVHEEVIVTYTSKTRKARFLRVSCLYLLYIHVCSGGPCTDRPFFSLMITIAVNTQGFVWKFSVRCMQVFIYSFIQHKNRVCKNTKDLRGGWNYTCRYH